MEFKSYSIEGISFDAKDVRKEIINEYFNNIGYRNKELNKINMENNSESFELFGRIVITSHNIDDLVSGIGKQVDAFGRSLQNIPDELLSENCEDQAHLIKTKILLLRKELDDLDDYVDNILSSKGDSKIAN